MMTFPSMVATFSWTVVTSKMMTFPLDVGNVEDDDLPLNGGNVQTHVTHPGSPPGGIWLGSARGKSG